MTDLRELRRASQRPQRAVVHAEKIEKITQLMKPDAMPLEDTSSDVEGPPKGDCRGVRYPQTRGTKTLHPT